MIELVLEFGPSGHPDERRIAGVALHGFRRHRSTAIEFAGGSARNACQGVEAGMDDQLRSRARAVVPAPWLLTAELDQGIGATLPVAPVIILGWLYQCGERNPHGGSAFGIKQPIDAHDSTLGLADVQIAALIGAVRLGQGGRGIDAVLKSSPRS